MKAYNHLPSYVKRALFINMQIHNSELCKFYKALMIIFSNLSTNKMKQYSDLTDQQKQELLKFPVYITLLAASDSKLDDTERMVAIKFAHTRSFSCEPLLSQFCKESEIFFESNLALIEMLLPTDKKKREEAIRKEVVKLDKILSKLGEEYVLVMHKSMKIFKDHVSRAHHSVIEDFILPISIPGLTD